MTWKKAHLAIVCLIAGLQSMPAVAWEGWYSHSGTPYPPSCVLTLTVPYNTDDLGRNQSQVSDTIYLSPDNATQAPVEVDVEVIRRSCTEDNRSALYMRLRDPSGSYVAPRISALIDGEIYPLRLSREPNTRFEDFATKTIDRDFIRFIIDGAAFDQWDVNQITADQYNNAFRLIIEDAGVVGFRYEYEISANNPSSGYQPRRQLLQGRLSGLWVAEGTVDQGFQISLQENFTNEEIKLYAFLTWFTFDNEGNPLWLAGGGDFFHNGTNNVTLTMELVTNGEFMGDKPADRLRLQDAILIARSCNRLEFRYRLEDIGLGNGHIFLKRLYSLETAGYACRDFQARIDTIED